MSEEAGQHQDEVLEEVVLEEVTEHPGATAQEVAHAVPSALLRKGRPAVTMSRDRALGVLRTLEQAGKVTRRTGQASVGFYPAPEASHAE